MAKISDEDRHKYLEKVSDYQTTAKTILKREENILQLIKKEPATAAFKRLALVDEMLNLASNYIIISCVSQNVLKVRNEDALNLGRKSLYKSVIYLEEVVSNLVDAPYSEYEDKLNAIASVDAAKRYLIIRKMGLAIQLLENAYGDNTKWKWSFVELEGRFAAACKNIINLKAAVVNTDPRAPAYEPTMFHLRLAKTLLGQVADRYREKYELSTNRIDDFKMGIRFLNSLRRMHIVLGESSDADQVKKKLEIWKSKLETDIKKRVEYDDKQI